MEIEEKVIYNDPVQVIKNSGAVISVGHLVVRVKAQDLIWPGGKKIVSLPLWE